MRQPPCTRGLYYFKAIYENVDITQFCPTSDGERMLFIDNPYKDNLSFNVIIRDILAAMNVRKVIGDNIRGYRKIIGLPQNELAKIAGLNRTFLASIERGEKNLTIDTLVKIANVIGIPIHFFLIEGIYKASRITKRYDS